MLCNMTSNPDISNSDNSNSTVIKVLLADSDSIRVKKVISYIERKSKYSSIHVCDNYLDLLTMLDREMPDLFLLGTFVAYNCFDVTQECRNFHKDLKIFLLSSQSFIDRNFARFAVDKGLAGIISSSLIELDVLIESLQQPQLLAAVVDATTTFTAQTMLMSIQEISQVGNNYFGTLAQGNYWRKSHALAQQEFPRLQNWSANHFGAIDYDEAIGQSQLTNEDIHSIQRWIDLYITECERTVEDFRFILKNSNISQLTIQLLPDSG
jgi:hypothetical protein